MRRKTNTFRASGDDRWQAWIIAILAAVLLGVATHHAWEEWRESGAPPAEVVGR